jgi:hypothetical protein
MHVSLLHSTEKSGIVYMIFINKLEKHKTSNLQYIPFLSQLQRNVNCKTILYVKSCEGLTTSAAGVQSVKKPMTFVTDQE